MITSMFISMWVSNMATMLMLLPIVDSTVNEVCHKLDDDEYGTCFRFVNVSHFVFERIPERLLVAQVSTRTLRQVTSEHSLIPSNLCVSRGTNEAFLICLVRSVHRSLIPNFEGVLRDRGRCSNKRTFKEPDYSTR